MKKYGQAFNTTDLLKTIAFIYVFCLMTCLYACTLNTKIKSAEDKEREQILRHNIKAIKIFVTEFRNGISQPVFLYQLKEYNNEGLLTKETNYNNQEQLISVINYEYDKNGNLNLSTSKSADSGLIFRETRTYNKHYQRDELIFYLPDGTYKYRNISTYDKDGKLLQLAYYWPEGLRCINKYSYNDGLMVEDVEYDAHGKLNYNWIYNYDEKGNMIQRIQYYPDKKITAKNTYEYINGLLMKESFFMGDFINKYLIFEYDSKRLMTTKSEFSQFGTLQVKYRYEYQLN